MRTRPGNEAAIARMRPASGERLPCGLAVLAGEGEVVAVTVAALALCVTLWSGQRSAMPHLVARPAALTSRILLSILCCTLPCTLSLLPGLGRHLRWGWRYKV